MREQDITTLFNRNIRVMQGAFVSDIFEVFSERPADQLTFDGQIVVVHFRHFQDRHWGASDFLALCEQAPIVLLDELDQVDLSNRNLARRFILFIGEALTADEVYNHKVKLIIKSQVPLDALFAGLEGEASEEVFMAQRCLSRLMEMQTCSYLRQSHLARGDETS